MKNQLIKVGALVVMLFARSVAAQPTDIPTRCPSLSTGKAVLKQDVPRTPEQAEAGKLAAEAQAVSRVSSRENVARAISLAEQAVKSDPNNVTAYLVLARAHAASKRYMDVPSKIAAQRAWENLTKARAIDPENIERLSILADRVIFHNRDYKCAKQIIERALERDPLNARTNYYYAQILGGMGSFDLAFTYADKAMTLADADSRNFVLINSGRLRYMAGKYDWVLDHYARYLESDPSANLAHFYRGFAFGAKGMFQEALAEQKMATPSWKGDAGAVAALALAYVSAGQPETAREILQELVGRDARGEHVVAYRIAAVYEVLGDRDQAVRWLNREVDTGDGIGGWLLWLNHDPVWNRMRNDGRFKEIQKRAGWKM